MFTLSCSCCHKHKFSSKRPRAAVVWSHPVTIMCAIGMYRRTWIPGTSVYRRSTMYEPSTGENTTEHIYSWVLFSGGKNKTEIKELCTHKLCSHNFSCNVDSSLVSHDCCRLGIKLATRTRRPGVCENATAALVWYDVHTARKVRRFDSLQHVVSVAFWILFKWLTIRQSLLAV